MQFVWDEAKRQSNLAKHGLDFQDAGLVYDSPDKLTFHSERQGEGRKIDIAMIALKGLVLLLVYFEQGGDVRVISFRRASRKERTIYEAARAEQD